MKRNGAIDFWKFAFSVVIVLFHSQYMAANNEHIFKGGRLAVEFFFAVSGFLMAAKVMKSEGTSLSLGKDTFAFIKRKVVTLMPAIYVAWIIAFIVDYVSEPIPFPAVLKNILSSVWELLFVWESGLSGYRANSATWYLSGMLIAMAVIYPLLKKFKETFLYIIAPLATLLLYGQLYRNGSLAGPSKLIGLLYKGQLRAYAGICLGCVCYLLYTKIKTIRFSTFSRALISLLEIAGFVFAIVYCYGDHGYQLDYSIILIFAICIPLSFSHLGIIANLFDNRLFYWLGSFSYPLFLGHVFWSIAMPRFFPGVEYQELLVRFLIIVTVTALFIMYFSKLLQLVWRKISPSIKKIFVVTTP